MNRTCSDFHVNVKDLNCKVEKLNRFTNIHSGSVFQESEPTNMRCQVFDQLLPTCGIMVLSGVQEVYR